MTVSPAQTTIHIQRSEWPSEPTEASHRTQSSIQYDQERFLRSPSKPKNILPAITLLTGLLVGGVVAAVGFTLWVSSSKEITTSTVTTTTSETTTSTSTTIATVTTTSSIEFFFSLAQYNNRVFLFFYSNNSYHTNNQYFMVFRWKYK